MIRDPEKEKEAYTKLQKFFSSFKIGDQVVIRGKDVHTTFKGLSAKIVHISDEYILAAFATVDGVYHAAFDIKTGLHRKPHVKAFIRPLFGARIEEIDEPVIHWNGSDANNLPENLKGEE